MSRTAATPRSLRSTEKRDCRAKPRRTVRRGSRFVGTTRYFVSELAGKGVEAWANTYLQPLGVRRYMSLNQSL